MKTRIFSISTVLGLFFLCCPFYVRGEEDAAKSEARAATAPATQPTRPATKADVTVASVTEEGDRLILRHRAGGRKAGGKRQRAFRRDTDVWHPGAGRGQDPGRWHRCGEVPCRPAWRAERRAPFSRPDHRAVGIRRMRRADRRRRNAARRTNCRRPTRPLVAPAPIWLIVSICTLLGGVWSAYVFVISQIIAIRKGARL